MNYYLKSGAQWLRLSYDGATAEMRPELIAYKQIDIFTYAASWGTRSAAERQRKKYLAQFPELEVYSESRRRKRERECLEETAAQWLAVFQRDEPGVEFKLSRNRPKGGQS